MTSPPLTLLAPVLAGVFLSTSCAQGASRRSAYDAGPAQRADDAGRFAGLDAGPDGGTIPPRDGGPDASLHKMQVKMFGSTVLNKEKRVGWR